MAQDQWCAVRAHEQAGPSEGVSLWARAPLTCCCFCYLCSQGGAGVRHGLRNKRAHAPPAAASDPSLQDVAPTITSPLHQRLPGATSALWARCGSTPGVLTKFIHTARVTLRFGHGSRALAAWLAGGWLSFRLCKLCFRPGASGGFFKSLLDLHSKSKVRNPPKLTHTSKH